MVCKSLLTLKVLCFTPETKTLADGASESLALGPERGPCSGKTQQPAEAVSLSGVKAAAVCQRRAVHPLWMADSSNDYKLSLELKAKDWRRQSENVPERVGFSTQCLLFKNCFHYSGIKQCGTQEENILMLLILRSPVVHDKMGGRESLCFSGTSSGSTAAWGLSGQGKR